MLLKKLFHSKREKKNMFDKIIIAEKVGIK